eukprot:TRINITY_DN26148_c0_g1_i2.p1 TRINITY_DN26148_c0_g1~~TRINITY_DN26148_c0_g1_i2.p1  ORF type:complete len:274 (-),score=43.58 TRINITY_DN26148_c0_g1_i2:112-933(-)
MSFVSGEAAPATVGSYAVVLSSQRRGRILAHDPDDEELAYKLAFEDGASPHFDWFPATAVMPETSTAAAWGPEGTSRTTAIAAAVSLSCEIPASKDGPPPRQLPEALSPRLSAQTERRWPSLEEDLAALGSRSEDWHRTTTPLRPDGINGHTVSTPGGLTVSSMHLSLQRSSGVAPTRSTLWICGGSQLLPSRDAQCGSDHAALLSTPAKEQQPTARVARHLTSSGCSGGTSRCCRGCPPALEGVLSATLRSSQRRHVDGDAAAAALTAAGCH